MSAFATNDEIVKIINEYDKIINNIIKTKNPRYPSKFWYLYEDYFTNKYNIVSKQIFYDSLRILCNLMRMDNCYERIFDLTKDVEKDIKDLDRIKKNYFQLNSGLLKFSTIHSFKGMQSPSIVVILNDGNLPEMVYCAITRAKCNLFIYDITDSPYNKFFKKYINR